MQSLTKHVPRPGPMGRKVVVKALQRSMTRMQVDSLDCVQFHWWAKMEQFCVANNIQLLTYGTLAGGLLLECYLGKAEPNSRAELYTAFLSKYTDMIDSWGGRSLFQDLLVIFETVARRYDCSVASVATCYVLDHPAVGGVIVGCWLGVAGAGQHISDSLRRCSPDLKLTGKDLATIEAVITLQGPHGVHQGLR